MDDVPELPAVQQSPLEYVGVLCDILRLNKILVVARHFERLPLNIRDKVTSCLLLL